MPRLPSFVLIALAGGCAPADSDEDGLVDSFEEAIGTSPDVADTDGDGFDDLTEHLTFHWATDPDDFPREAALPRLPPPTDAAWDELSADEGWSEGDFSRSWESEDQHGETLSLREFYGNVILVDMGAEWCGPCQQSAEGMEEEYQDRKDRGFVVLQLLLDGQTDQEEPNRERWAAEYNLTFPIFNEHGGQIYPHYIVDDGSGSFGIPNFSIIGRDFTIHSVYGPEDWGMIDDLLEEDPPEVEWLMPEDWETLRADKGIEAIAVPYGFTVVEGSSSGGSSGGSSDGETGGAGPWGGL
jgi:peroxiredoxin